MRPYHHGNLRHQLLSHAAVMAHDGGPESITLRELARRAGVSHSAPVHHFGTRSNLLAELAAEGFQSLNDTLVHHDGNIHAMGVAYVNWALQHPGHYSVMWQPRLHTEGSANSDGLARLAKERQRAWTLLNDAVAATRTTAPQSDENADAYAAFALVHGLASIWLSGALPFPPDPTSAAQEVTHRLRL